MGRLDIRICPKAGVASQCVCAVESDEFPTLISQAIIPHIPTDKPRLGHLVYEMILAHFLANDRQVQETPSLRHVVAHCFLGPPTNNS
jgi:hypothetical protein